MITMQAIPRTGVDAYKLLRDKVTHEAKTWSWGNKKKTRLKHARTKTGYIEIKKAGTIIVAEVKPASESDTFFFVEKFIGRLTAWFSNDLVSINMQFIPEPESLRKKRKK